jgi:integrating conjugative element protein (TIGR03761 family)
MATPDAILQQESGLDATLAANAQLGQLADATPDTMSLHTKDAYRIFTGRGADAAGKLPPIPGGRRFAAVLKSIWHLSANDNPYADWILIRMYEGLVAIRAHLSRVITAREEAIEILKRKGLSLAVMGSRSPKTVELGFRSPYGYATAEAIVEFDYYVRMIKTLIHKDRMSDDEGRAAIREVGRELRALFLEPIRWERHLLREELRPLSRSDFLPGADELAHQRVRAVVALFGEVPRKVFTGAQAPRHTRRRVKLSEAELRLLEQASLTAAEDIAAGGHGTAVRSVSVISRCPARTSQPIGIQCVNQPTEGSNVERV